jgi:chitinase
LFAREDAEKWAAEYPASRVFVGVSMEDKLGGEWDTGDLKDLYYGVLQFVEKLPSYGGLMLWNRYYDKKNHFISDS